MPTGIQVTRLYTIAYPLVSNADAEVLESFRRLHDPQASLIRAHFTLVFACAGVDTNDYLRHVLAVAGQSAPLEFVCRYATLGADHRREQFHQFLVPDEGYSGLSMLHDRLYTGSLATCLEPAVPFIPHITLGSAPDAQAVRQRCAEFNALRLKVRGRVDALTVVSVSDSLHEVATFSLGANQALGA